MNSNSNSQSCAKTCWLVALAIGILVALYLWLGADWGFFWALIIGVVIVVLGGKFLPQFFCSEATGQQEAVSDVAPIATSEKPAAPAPVSRSEPEPAPEPQPEPEPEPQPEPEPTPEPEPAKPASQSVIKASTSLPGQVDLASRRGSWRYQGDAQETAAAQSPAPQPEPVSESGGTTQPQGLAEAREGGGDDLKMIKGIGPKMEQLLNSMGYFHFDQIAGWDSADVAWVDDNLKGFKGRVSRDNWVGQAKSLAAGEETDFAKRAKKDGIYD